MPYTRPASKNPYVLIPDGALDAWNVAKANSATAAARVLIVGDSLGQGNNATSRLTQSFYALLRQYLTGSTGSTVGNSPYPLGGDWWPTSASVAGDPNYGTPAPWLLTNTPTFLTTGNWGKTPYWPGTPTNPATFTAPYACTEVDIHYLDVGAGTWTYTVDGGATQTVTLGGTGLQAKISLTGLASSAHVILFTGQSATNALAIEGCAIYPTAARRTSGIQFAWGASGGQELVTYGPLGTGTALGGGVADAPTLFSGRYGAIVTGCNNSSPLTVTLAATSPAPVPAPIVGQYVTFTGVLGSTGLNLTQLPPLAPLPIFIVSAYNSGTRVMTITTQTGTVPTAPGVWSAGAGQIASFNTGFGFPSQPHLTLFELAGGGDCINFRGAEAFEETYRRMISAIWRGLPGQPAVPATTPGTSIVAITGSVEWPSNATNPAGIPNSKYFHKYTQIARSICDEYGLGWVNLLSFWGSGQSSSGYYAPGDFHPANAGHALIANLLETFI